MLTKQGLIIQTCRSFSHQKTLQNSYLQANTKNINKSTHKRLTQKMETNIHLSWAVAVLALLFYTVF